MKFKIIFCFLLFFTLINCTSIKNQNEQRIEKISIQKLQNDINYVQQKLMQLHPSYDLYISKEKLNYKFDSIRKVVAKPMTSKEFYFVIAPIIASVGQGHMSMSPVYKKYTKKQTKAYKNKGDGPLSQFTFDWQNDKLYIIKNKSKNKTIKIGTEVVAINDIKPQTIYHQYQKTLTSDGYNKTFLRKLFSKRFTYYLTDEIGINDSLLYTFNQNDSILKKTISRLKPVKKQKTPLDSIAKTSNNSQIVKAKAKITAKNNTIFGYNKTTKEYCKSLVFKNKDSLTAYLKIVNFSEGNYKKAYKLIFDSIQKQKCKTLIIDLRDNPGGLIKEIVNLNSYLTNAPFQLSQKAIVTSKTSLWHSGIFAKIPKITYPFAAVFYPFYMGVTYFKTKKGNDQKYYTSLASSKINQPNSTHFKGKIYVLINGGSFSASCLLSSSLKENKDITFVGEETGGDFNGTVAGIMPVIKLPNSKIPWRLGLMDIRPLNQTTIKGRGIFPDKEIIPTIANKINNNDPELDWVLSQIKINQQL